ncbi:Histidinol phosphatase [Candidatus Hodgkinia cicadicola]|nr:Histidinol phosphatase [Candidatus Hodgkinia cicadicola]
MNFICWVTPSALFLCDSAFIVFSKLVFVNIMTLTQKFYFKLINALLDAAGADVKTCNQCKILDCVSKSEHKFDPMSAYDSEIEISIRDALTLMTPNANTYGEELGLSARAAANTWFVDPIDGTKAFVSGSPIWGTILGIAKRNNIVMGAVNHPMLTERLVAVDGVTYYRGCDANFKRLPLQSQRAKPLTQCVVGTSSADAMSVAERAKFAKLTRVARHVIYYCDCYVYTLLAKGYVDAVVECRFRPYDFLGLVPVLKGVGCCICNWQGAEACYADKILVSRNADIQTSLLELINDIN